MKIGTYILTYASACFLALAVSGCTVEKEYIVEYEAPEWMEPPKEDEEEKPKGLAGLVSLLSAKKMGGSGNEE